MRLVLSTLVALWSITTVAGVEPASPVPLDNLAHIHGVVLSAGTNETLLATHHGLYSVDPQGLATMVSAQADDFMGFTADAQGRLYASGHPATGGNIGVLGSGGVGDPWLHLSPGANGPVDFHPMTVSPKDPPTLYGSYGDIQVSRDGGKTWVVAGTVPAEVIDLAAAADDAGHLYAGTMAGLLESKDFGRTWTAVVGLTAPVTATELAPDGSLHVFVAGVGLSRLRPDGSFETLSSITGQDVFLHMAFRPDAPASMVAVTSRSVVLSSTDAGKTWSPFVP